jgi:hypothetical protein
VEVPRTHVQAVVKFCRVSPTASDAYSDPSPKVSVSR